MEFYPSNAIENAYNDKDCNTLELEFTTESEL